MNKNLRNLVKSHVAEYLMYHFPQLQIKSTKLFECPFRHNHSQDNNKPSCKIYPQFGYKVTCFNCGELGTIFDIFKKVEPDMKHLSDDEIADYIMHLLDIKTNEEVDKLLELYSNSGFYLIPLQPKSKNPIQGESWKKNITNDIRKWREWVDAGLGLGLVCGKKSNVIVIDIDTKEIPEEIQPLLNGTSVAETRKGWHYLYCYDEDFDFVNHQNLRRKGYEIDFIANNSYVIVAPSIVDDYVRTWNGKKISKTPDKLKKFLLELLQKDSKEEIKPDDEIQKAIENDEINLEGSIPEGQRDTELTKIGGVFRKQMNSSNVLSVLLFINKNFCKPPLSFSQVKKIVDSLNKYDTYDKKDLAKEILEHLKMESVRFANTVEISKSLGYTKKEIEDALDYLLKEQKVQKIGKQFKALNKIEWDTNFMGLSKPLDFEVPYFEKYARLENGSMIIVGAKTGTGKSTLAMNFIKEFVDKGITPYYVCTEAGSKFSLIGASLGLKEGDYKFKVVPDATSVEFEDNSVIVCDWVRPQDYAKTDLMMENLNNQLIKHGGLLIAMVQLRKDGSFFAPDLFDFFANVVTTYNWTERINEKTKQRIIDNENTYFKTTKIRDSKNGLQYVTIPTFFNKQTKQISLRSGE